MNKSPKTQYQSLQKALAPSFPVMETSVDTILDQEVSSYPILIVHRQEINLGVPIVLQKTAGDWSVNASTLEELATKQIIEMARIDRFREVYKDPRQHLCLFVLDGEQAEFVFLPREEISFDPTE